MRNMQCDGCDLAFHTYCLQPALDQIPEVLRETRGCGSGLTLDARAGRAALASGLQMRVFKKQIRTQIVSGRCQSPLTLRAHPRRVFSRVAHLRTSRVRVGAHGHQARRARVTLPVIRTLPRGAASLTRSPAARAGAARSRRPLRCTGCVAAPAHTRPSWSGR